MKKKTLEIFLQKIPSHPHPSPHLEQYHTPATLAAEILYFAYHCHDIEGRSVADYGCGTGIFALGAAALKARHVTAIDIDRTSLDIAKTYSQKMNLTIEFIHSPIHQITQPCETILMNPPFGAQYASRNTDRIFLSTALKNAQVTYSLHQAKTHGFIEQLLPQLGGIITHKKEYRFPLPHQFIFHEKKIKTISVNLYRILQRGGNGTHKGK